MAKSIASPLPSWYVEQSTIRSTKPTYGFHVTYGMRFVFVHFSQLYAAKAFINLMLDGDDYTRTNDFQIESDRGVRIRMENIPTRKGPSRFDEVLTYQFTPQEAEFTFPDSFIQSYGTVPRLKTLRECPAAPEPDHATETPVKVAQRAPSTPKPASKPKPEGLVTVASIADELKIDAKAARTALRKAKIEKPEHGWSFAPADVARITAAIKEHLK